MDADLSSKPEPIEPRSLWRFQLRHMIFAIFYFAIFFWLVALFDAPFLIGTLVLLLGILVGIAVLVTRRRSRQHDALIRMIAISADHDMSLASALRAFSDETHGRYRQTLLRAADDLDSGVQLPDVLDRNPKVLSKDLELFARIGWWTGKLGQALREASTHRLAFRPVWIAVAWRLEYLVYLVLFTQTVITFLLYFIIPKFEAIFKDFGINLPPITIYLIIVSHFAISRWIFLFVLALLEFLVLLYFPYSMFGSRDRGITPLDRIFVSRHSSRILRALAWTMETGKPLASGVEVLAGWYPSGWIQAKLKRVFIDIQHGGDWISSLCSHGLIRSADASLLESATRVGNLPWALRTVADMRELRFIHWLQVVLRTLFPLALILVGAVVGLVGVAYFTPLAYLIERLAR